VLDSRQGRITNIKIKDFNLADTISAPSSIYAPTPQVYGSVTDIEIGGKSYGFEIGPGTNQPIFNSNFGPIPGLFIHYDRPFKGGSYTLGTDNRYGILQRDGVLDVGLEGARDSGGPSAPLDGIWLPIITNPNDPSTPWTSLPGENSSVALCTGFTAGPFGTASKAGVIHVVGDPDTISLSKDRGSLPPPGIISHGDWFVIGVWAKAMDPARAVPSSVAGFQVTPGVTIDHLLSGNVALINDQAARTGGDWHLCVGAGKVTHVLGSGPFQFFFLIGASDRAASIDFGDNAYAYPLALWIPASKGYTDAEVARWVRHVRGIQYGVPLGNCTTDVRICFGSRRISSCSLWNEGVHSGIVGGDQSRED
jgi:hypothetical protein